MNRNLQRLQHMLRETGLLRYVDEIRFWRARLEARQSNREFLAQQPDFAAPPAHLAFDAYNHVNWHTYYHSGLGLAQRIVAELDRFITAPPEAVYEWGCGPARVVRHMPALLPHSAIYGSDYNPETVAWCSQHVPNVTFSVNALTPPLPYAAQTFDFAYAVSVFTHLSAENCVVWLDELRRVLRPGGILLFSTHGAHYAQYLLPEEQSLYQNGTPVVRGKYLEGKKYFLSFHSPDWVRHELLKNCRVLDYFPGGFTGTEQDYWIVQT